MTKDSPPRFEPSGRMGHPPRSSYRCCLLRTLAIAASLVTWHASATCAAGPSSDRFRVTILGIDGATWRVIDPMLARGELPSIARLIGAGVRAPLRSRMPLWSPAVWTTVATGVPRERHGVSRFENASGNLSASIDRRAPALWTLASAAGQRTAVIGWWVTYPAEAVNGVIVSERALKTRDADLREMLDQTDARAEARYLIYPPEVVPEISDILGTLHDDAPPPDEPGRVLKNMRAEDRAVVDLLIRLRQRAGPFALEMALLRGVDPVSHHFWKYHEPDAEAYPAELRPTAEEVRRHGDTIAAHYRYVDGLLASLDLLGDPDHVVLIISDHGFEAGRQPFRGGELSGTHESSAALYGIFIASGGPIRHGASLERVRITDIAPTVLHLLGLPVAESLAGNVLEEIFEPGWWASHPVRKIAAYAGPPVNLPAGATAAHDSPVDGELREQLRALGYLE